MMTVGHTADFTATSTLRQRAVFGLESDITIRSYEYAVYGMRKDCRRDRKKGMCGAPYGLRNGIL